MFIHYWTAEREHAVLVQQRAFTESFVFTAIAANPVRELGIRRKRKSDLKVKGAPALGVHQVRALLTAISESELCSQKDLRDPVIVLAATGVRRSELLALRWEDVDLDDRILTIGGSVVRLKGQGLVRQDTTKGGAERSVPLPQFAVDALHRRKGEVPRPNTAGVIFPSSAGTLRDPDNFGKQRREVRESLGLPDVSSHSFRKTVATLIDDSGLSARIGADQLGHARPSMTQDVYMSRGQVHAAVADVLDRAAGITDE